MKVTQVFFKEFMKKQTAEAYIDGLRVSLRFITIGPPVKLTSSKRRFSYTLMEEIYGENSDNDEQPRQSKRKLIVDIDPEDVDLPETSLKSKLEVTWNSTSKEKKHN